MIDYDAVLFSKNKEKKDKKTISYFSQKNNKPSNILIFEIEIQQISNNQYGDTGVVVTDVSPTIPLITTFSKVSILT